MEDSFKLLEEKIEHVARRLTEFRSETASLRDALAEAQSRAKKAEKQLKAADGSGGGGGESSKKVESLSREIEALQEEREELRSRLGRLVELLEGLD